MTGLNGDARQPVGLHDLRHSFVALALAPGLTLAETALSRPMLAPRRPWWLVKVAVRRGCERRTSAGASAPALDVCLCFSYVSLFPAP